MDQTSHPPFVPDNGVMPGGAATESTRWAGAAATALLVVWSGTEVFLVAAHLLRVRAIDGISAGTPEAHSRFTSADSLVALAGLARVAVFVAAGVAFWVWLFKARANAERLADYPHRWGRPWLVFGWLLPVANLWIPRQVLDDIWQASAGRSERRRPALLLVWWGCFLLFEIGDRIVSRVTAGAGLDGIRNASVGEAGLAVPGLAAAVLAVLVIWKINGLQASTAQHLATVMATPVPGMAAPVQPPAGGQWPAGGDGSYGGSRAPHGSAPAHGDDRDAGWSPVQ